MAKDQELCTIVPTNEMPKKRPKPKKPKPKSLIDDTPETQNEISPRLAPTRERRVV